MKFQLIIILLVLLVSSPSLFALGFQENPYRGELIQCYQRGMYIYRYLTHVLRNNPNNTNAVLPIYFQYAALRVRYAAVSKFYWRWENQNKRPGYMNNLLEGNQRRNRPIENVQRNYTPPVVVSTPKRPQSIHHGLIEGHNIMADVILKVNQEWSFSLPKGSGWHERLTNQQVVRVLKKEECMEEGRQCVKYHLLALREGKAQYTLSKSHEPRELNFAITVSNGQWGSNANEDNAPDYGDIHYSY